MDTYGGHVGRPGEEARDAEGDKERAEELDEKCDSMEIQKLAVLGLFVV